jgi:hypothetical protein
VLARVQLLDARGAISVTERARYIGRVRAMAKSCAEAYVASRARLGFPLLEPALGALAKAAYDEAFAEPKTGGVNAGAAAAARVVAGALTPAMHAEMTAATPAKAEVARG